jgi:hypothetical protein
MLAVVQNIQHHIALAIVLDTYQHTTYGNFRTVIKKLNKLLLLTPIIAVLVVALAIGPLSALAKSEVAGGYDTGFARGAEEARTAISQFNNGSLKSIDGDNPPSCPLADKQDDYCDGWKDGWRQTVLDTL